MDFRQSQPFAKYLQASGWKVNNLGSGILLYIFDLPVVGSIVRVPRSTASTDLKQLIQKALKYNAALIKIEPDALSSDIGLKKRLEEFGFIFDQWSIEPTTTLIVDLTQTEEKLFSDLRKNWRRNIRIAKQSDIKISKSEDIDSFIKIWQQNASQKGFLIESGDKIKIFWQELKKQDSANLLFAQVNKQPIASIFLINWQGKTHLWHLADNGQLAQFQPLYLLIWEAILFAKRKGCQEFDFEGIEDPRLPYTKKNQPTYFKKGFGGVERQYIGSYVKFLKPLYALPYFLMGRIKPDFFRAFYKMIYA